ncbi:NUDIX domain-containing protein [Saccharicrinis fermentans]|uniref:NADH pyrophosphatase n=1 Tax=Saccharicrinis fermentans DSM 9555 = JCM 21142 TaxID=869213 RepID=W7YMV2_9BACT|nr:NUDIX domain-containing protein [Saccharicrinis fermentans]GAF03729.1 NADH pyrophosphatase [Saccharicrinis fermentans DSM 9555 = JCM 21142]
MMTRPENVLKFCPKCGSSAFHFEGERSFLCNSCKFHFFINGSAAVAALIENEKDELLLTVRAFHPNKGMLDLPGGFVDPNESAEDALNREIKEELNLDIKEAHYLGSFPNQYVYSGYTVYTCDLAFRCKVQGWNQVHIHDDISDIQFVNKENIDWNAIGAESIKKIIKAHWNM